MTEKQLLKEYEETKLGPATYNPAHKLVEPRTDIGIVEIKKPKSPRNKSPAEKVLDINPNYDINKPNKLVFAYHEPSKDLAPIHTPEKIRNPGKWQYYDINLDAVREEVAKEIAFARNLSLEEFKNKEEFFHLLVEHNKRQEKRPVVGQYSPKDQDTKIEIDFSKAQGRTKFVDEGFLSDQD